MSDHNVNEYKRLMKESLKTDSDTELYDMLLAQMDTHWYAMAQNEREYVEAWVRDRQSDKNLLIGVIAVLVLACAAVGAVRAEPAYEMGSCDPTLPSPPLLVRRPNGETISVVRVNYDLAGRNIDLVETPRIFCSGVE